MSVINQNNIKNDTGVDLTTSIDSKLEVANIIAGTNVTLDTVGNDITINATGSGSTVYVTSSTSSYVFAPSDSNTIFKYSGSLKWNGSIDISSLSVGDTFEIINTSPYDSSAVITGATYYLINGSTSSTLIIKGQTSETFLVIGLNIFQQGVIGLPAAIGAPYLNSTYYRTFNTFGESDILNYSSGSEVFCEGTYLSTLTLSTSAKSNGYSIALTIGQNVSGSVVVSSDDLAANFYWLDVNTGTYQTTSTISILSGQRVTLFKSGTFINVMSSTMNVNPDGMPPAPPIATIIYNGAKVNRLSDYSINTNDVDEILPLTNTIFDTGGYNPGTGHLNISNTGYYRLSANIILGTNIGAGNVRGLFTINNISQPFSDIALLDYNNSNGGILNFSEEFYLTSGDQVRVAIRFFNQDFATTVYKESTFGISYLGS